MLWTAISRRRCLSVLAFSSAAIATVTVGVSTAAASSIGVTVSPAKVGVTTTLTYTGVVDAGGGVLKTGDLLGVIRAYAQPGDVGCAATIDEMIARVAAEQLHVSIDVNDFGPFSKVGEHVFDEAGKYTLCVYLRDYASSSQGAVVTATSSLTVASACKPPRLKGLTLAQAKRELADADCKLGKVTKPRRVPKGTRLVVKSQSGNDPVNIVLTPKKSKRP
jgi:hypothetical protein